MNNPVHFKRISCYTEPFIYSNWSEFLLARQDES